MNNESMLFYYEWAEICEDLTDEEFGSMVRAAVDYAKNGVNPTFSDRALKACWKAIKKAIDRNLVRYAKQVEANRENGKKGGRPKKEEVEENPKTQVVNFGFSEKPNKTLRERVRERDPERDRGRGREREEVAPSARITLTTTTSEEIARSWNGQNCTQDIQSCFYPDQRRDRTEMAVAISGGMERFLQLIEGLGSQAYFKDRNVDFDWFVDPKNFQNILEGKYKDPLKKAKEGWV